MTPAKIALIVVIAILIVAGVIGLIALIVYLTSGGGNGNGSGGSTGNGSGANCTIPVVDTTAISSTFPLNLNAYGTGEVPQYNYGRGSECTTDAPVDWSLVTTGWGQQDKIDLYTMVTKPGSTDCSGMELIGSITGNGVVTSKSSNVALKMAATGVYAISVNGSGRGTAQVAPDTHKWVQINVSPGSDPNTYTLSTQLLDSAC